MLKKLIIIVISKLKKQMKIMLKVKRNLVINKVLKRNHKIFKKPRIKNLSAMIIRLMIKNQIKKLQIKMRVLKIKIKKVKKINVESFSYKKKRKPLELLSQN